MTAGIYRITDITTGEFYIGRSKNIEHRWKTHLQDLKSRKHSNDRLQSTYDIYGSEAFRFDVVECCEDVRMLPSREAYWQYKLFPKINSVDSVGSPQRVSVGLQRIRESRGLEWRDVIAAVNERVGRSQIGWSAIREWERKGFSYSRTSKVMTTRKIITTLVQLYGCSEDTLWNASKETRDAYLKNQN